MARWPTVGAAVAAPAAGPNVHCPLFWANGEPMIAAVLALRASPIVPTIKVPVLMKTSRVATSLAASVALVLAAPAVAPAASAVTQSVGETTLGSFAKALNTLSGRGDASCVASTQVSNPFAQWGDKANYVEAPGGSFEPGSTHPWTSAGSTSFASDNEPWRVSGRSGDGRSVMLAPGSSVTSVPMCAGLAYPTIRFFARAAKGTSATALVTARYTGPDGLLAALPLGIVSVGSAWQPGNATLTGSGVPVFTGTTLSIRIAPLTGSIQVDDVYVDPFRRF